MKETPILFKGEMVRAILAGQKTQTRRIVDPAKCPLPACWDAWQIPGSDKTFGCPYGSDDNGEGEPDRLWVKETWRPSIVHSHGQDACDCSDVRVSYVADGATRDFRDEEIPNEWTMPKAAQRGNVTPLFMPRWASRLTLDVTSVRIERLQDITEEDARAEGVTPDEGMAGVTPTMYRDAFRDLWDSINGDRAPWRSNPWLWVVSFKRVEEARRAA